MNDLNEDMRCIATGAGTFGPEAPEAWMAGTCPECGSPTFMVVAFTLDLNDRPNNELVFARCSMCRRGVVVNEGVASPEAAPLPPVEGCPSDVEGAWDEACGSLRVGATTAAVMMCRKLLFHIAVEKGLPPQDDRGRAPSFAACLQHLREVGLLTPPLEPWVEHIRDVGNEANHDLASIDPESANRVATFTRQLLVTTYEMPHKMKVALGSAASDS